MIEIIIVTGLGYLIYTGLAKNAGAKVASGRLDSPTPPIPEAKKDAILKSLAERIAADLAGGPNAYNHDLLKSFQVLAGFADRTGPGWGSPPLPPWRGQDEIDGVYNAHVKVELERILGRPMPPALPMPQTAMPTGPQTATAGAPPPGAAGYDYATARALAADVKADVNANGKRYDRRRLAAFERAAGMSDVRGIWGPTDAGAVAYFIGPAADNPPGRNSSWGVVAAKPYTPPIRAGSTGHARAWA